MKKLLMTSAIAVVAMAGTASAQSVLERVLGQIDNATNLASVNGTFANIAENIGGAQTTTGYVDTNGNILTPEAYATALQNASDSAAAGVTPVAQPVATDYDLTNATEAQAYADAVAAYNTYLEAVATARSVAEGEFAAGYTAQTVYGVSGIDGSISNVVDGIDGATQEAIASIDVSAIEWNMPTLDFGDMATTALGAVNTGDITLGVNSAVDEAQTSTTQAVSSVMNQIGGSADTGAIVLNVASNMTGVNGSISNTMTQVNGAIGNLSTTALGAVNTGTITSGVNAAVQGIVGTSGQ